MILYAVVACGVAVAVLLLLLYRGKLKFSELVVKTPFVEAKLVPSPAQSPLPAEAPTSTPAEVRQVADDGGQIINSPVKAPARSGAKICQAAEKNGRIEGSGIDLS